MYQSISGKNLTPAGTQASVTTAEATTGEHPILYAIEELEAAIKALDQSTITLCQTLEPIVHPTGEKEPGRPALDFGMISPVNREIRQQTANIGMIHDRLDSLRKLLEL